eukprot:161597-Karenia_brevis.AAC.1
MGLQSRGDETESNKASKRGEAHVCNRIPHVHELFNIDAHKLGKNGSRKSKTKVGKCCVAHR